MNISYRIGLVALVAIAAVPASRAAQDDASADELQGVLINETRSVAGQAFYTGFFTVWQARDPDGEFTLVITEKPNPRSAGSSVVTVSYENAPVYRRVIPFNAGRATAYGEGATEAVFNRVVEQELGREAPGPDMAASGY